MEFVTLQIIIAGGGAGVVWGDRLRLLDLWVVWFAVRIPAQDSCSSRGCGWRVDLVLGFAGPSDDQAIGWLVDSLVDRVVGRLLADGANGWFAAGGSNGWLAAGGSGEC